jgi:hypothetical protein
MNAVPLTAGAALPRLHIACDNGFTGAIAALLPDGSVLGYPVKVIDLGRERLLDVEGNLALLQGIIARAGVPVSGVVVTYEQSPINPYFGHKSNFTNGKNGEFWRVLLSMAKIPYTWVNPKVWQKHVFRAVRGDDTKAMAALVVKQRFPSLELNGHTKTELEGIHDALCIALWSRENSK